MWKYKNQIKLRWIAFILGLVTLVLFLLIVNYDMPITKVSMKIFLSKAQVGFEYLNFTSYIIIIMAIICLLLLGIPSACILIPLILLKSCTFAFVVTTACQIVATLIAMWISSYTNPEGISELLQEKIESNKENYQTFAFWARIYYNIPLRTIDRFTSLVHNEDKAYIGSLVAAGTAILIRTVIPAMLLKHIFDQFTLLSPNPAQETEKLLTWGIVLIVYTLIPKIPEIMICPAKVKSVILEIESPTLPSSKDKLREEAEAKAKQAEAEAASKKLQAGKLEAGSRTLFNTKRV